MNSYFQICIVEAKKQGNKYCPKAVSSSKTMPPSVHTARYRETPVPSSLLNTEMNIEYNRKEGGIKPIEKTTVTGQQLPTILLP